MEKNHERIRRDRREDGTRERIGRHRRRRSDERRRLTHGGFYRHFGSREDLIDEAVECALGQWSKRAAGSDLSHPENDFRHLSRNYLSVSHRNSPGNGCAVATLSGEAWRGGKRIRQAFTRELDSCRPEPLPLRPAPTTRKGPGSESRRRVGRRRAPNTLPSTQDTILPGECKLGGCVFLHAKLSPDNVADSAAISWRIAVGNGEIFLDKCLKSFRDGLGSLPAARLLH